jgi:hypothetical protein
MEKTLSLTTFAEEAKAKTMLKYWLSQPPDARFAEVERLRREHIFATQTTSSEPVPTRLLRTLTVVERFKG